MIVFKSIPLSFSIFIRFVAVMPIFLMAMIAYFAVVAVMAYVLGYVSFLLPALLWFGAGLAIVVVPTLIGCRIGLGTKGVVPRNTDGQLLWPALGYGLLIAVFGSAVSYLAGYLLRTLGPAPIHWMAIVPYIVAIFQAALLVPLASASVGRDPGRRDHTPLSHFGAGLIPLMFLAVFGAIVIAFAPAVAAQIAAALGMGDLVGGGAASIRRALRLLDPSQLRVSAIAMLVLALVGQLWLLCLQCAGATLVYMDLAARGSTGPTADPVPEVDFRALRQSRMSNRR